MKVLFAVELELELVLSFPMIFEQKHIPDNAVGATEGPRLWNSPWRLPPLAGG